MAASSERLILASGSRGRRYLLETAGYSFDVLPSAIDEPTEAGTGDARSYVAEIAWRKAADVAPRVAAGIVVAADTVGWLDGRPVLKPDGRDGARAMIRSLAGREHELWSGVVLWRRPDDVQVVWQECSVVTMKAMSDGEIEAYLDTRLWEGCSGAYAIQMEGDPLLAVRGSVSNVVGLPLESLTRWLSLVSDAPAVRVDTSQVD